jgi:hypothetical protein
MVEDQNGQAPLTVHLHIPTTTEPEVVVVEATVLVRELLVGFDGHQVWVEEAAVPLELDVSLAAAGVGHGTHLHRGPCREVEVEVAVAADGREVAHRFAPSARAVTVAEWAAGQLGLGSPADLELVDGRSGQVVAPATHLGSVAEPGQCAVSFELRRIVRVATIFVNTRPHVVPAGEITFDAVVKLAFPVPPPGQAIEYEVSYRNGPPENPKGTLLQGHQVWVREGTSFVVTATDKS